MEYVHKVLFPFRKKIRKSSIDSFFFDKSGKVSEHLIQGLKHITQASHHGNTLSTRKRRYSISQHIEVI